MQAYVFGEEVFAEFAEFNAEALHAVECIPKLCYSLCI